jgi:hypothetical protein
MIPAELKTWISNGISLGILNYSLAASLIPFELIIFPFLLSNGPDRPLQLQVGILYTM